MSTILDADTLEWLRSLPAEKAYREATDAVYRAGSASSDDFVDVYEQLVEQGILTWDEIEQFGGPQTL
jgi:hypothetical protein